MHYRKNIVPPNDDLPYEEARRVEDELFTRLHFGGKLNEETIRLLAILDVPLALEILSQDVEPDELHKARQLGLLKLDKVSQVAPGLDVAMKALWVFNMIKGDPKRIMAVCSRIGPLPCIALITASGEVWSMIPVIGSFLDRMQSLSGPTLHSMSYDSYMDCQNMVNQIERASEGLKLIAEIIVPEDRSDFEEGEVIERLNDYEFVESIYTLADTLRAVLLSTCTPGCLSMECNIDHIHDYPPISAAKRLLLAAVIRVAVANEVFKEFRDILALYLLTEINIRA